MDMLINRSNQPLDSFDEENIEAMKKVGINTYSKLSFITIDGDKGPKRYIRNFNYSMVEKLLNLFGPLIMDKDEITIFNGYVEGSK